MHTFGVRSLCVVLSGASLVLWAFVRFACTGLVDIRSVGQFLALSPDHLAEAVEFAILFLSGATFVLFSPFSVRVLPDGECRYGRFVAPVPWISLAAIGLSMIAMREIDPFGWALIGYAVAIATIGVLASALAFQTVYGNVSDGITAEPDIPALWDE